MTRYTLLYIALLLPLLSFSQERRVQNRPYTDLRPMHFGIVVGTNMMDTEFDNIGEQIITMPDGTQRQALSTCDQKDWDTGFNVGVLLETRLNTYFAFRLAPQLYFGTRNLAFYNYLDKDAAGRPMENRQTLRSVYVGANLDLIFASQRFNNHRPYIMAGIAPMLNLSTKSNDFVQLKNHDVFFEIGLGCDFYHPFFKLRPELKFMFGLTNALNKDHIRNIRDESLCPYAQSVSGAQTKMIVLSFYFE